MISGNPHFAKFKHVLIFQRVHVVADIMGDFGLQFADIPLKDAHFHEGHESGVFQDVDVTRYCVKVFVDAGKGLIRFQLSPTMVPSQVCLRERWIWSGIRQRGSVGGFRFQAHKVGRTAGEVNSLPLVLCGATWK